MRSFIIAFLLFVSFGLYSQDEKIKIEINSKEIVHFSEDNMRVQGSATSGSTILSQADGAGSIAVKGVSSFNGFNNSNYGGHFEAKGNTGRGVYGLGSNSSGVNYGGYFQSYSANGRGVYGVASGIGSVTNFGGYFRSFGGNGFGLYSLATSGNGVGLYAEGASSAAIFKGETEIRAKSNDAILSMKSVTDSGVNASRVIVRQDNGEDVYLGDVDPNGGDVFIRADGNDVIKLDATGLVGVNTNLPDKTLHIKGDLKIESNRTNPSVFAKTSDGTSTRWMMMDNNTKDILLGALDSNSDDLILKSNGVNRMYIKDNGNIGVGTSSPSENFHIKGDFNLESNTVGGDELMYVTSTEGLKSNILYYNELFDEIHLGDIDQNLDAFILESGGFNTITLENGNVGINMYPNHQLDLSTGEAYKPGGGSWKAPSDMRLKQNVKPFSDGLATLLKMNPVSYHYNQRSGYDPSVEYIGMIAQDLQRSAPYMVEKEKSGFLSIDPTALTYLLINAIKEQQKIIAELTQENKESEQRYQNLDDKLNEMTKKVELLIVKEN
ncbi:tail fiber domain-containing protein [Portibacter lacus]|uniref:Peptidase S74 domain-containing protein n=1 Tax=Portibacter lacus TaxID=1099794 RepID=A0AA37SSM7_9BACT|nr:tail fiber domain-containing protein [Portibacter lacus]GLR18814.1 hypothetical protein GCM10007940_34300 [Portibacter lacus]